jgi:alcohol dehydrogenase (cytochrome c)
MLHKPADGDWLNWRRSDSAWGYSPLKQINQDNVGTLQLAWSWAMEDTASNQAAPLVHDGIIYLPNPHGVIQALNGETGDLIWHYQPEITEREPPPNQTTASPRRPLRLGAGSGTQRSIAIYNNKVFGTTPDARIFAVDSATGNLIWDTQVADFNLGYHYTSGPLVVKGKLITGITGCGRYKDDVCFITAHDSATGAELWRTSTIARPGEPGGDTWGDLPLRFRAGGDAWITGSYDPETNLIYWGTAQAKPWASAVRGTDGAALYTNSTLALDPDTGKIQWYFQHLPAESHDMDEVFENILIDNNGRKSLFKMGKIGILWELDRTTGEFVSVWDLGYQNLVRVNSETGEVRYRDGAVPRVGVQINICPSTSGFKSWRSMAYSPDTHTMYVPLNLNCELATFGPVEKVLGGGGVGPVRRTNYFHPLSGNHLGEFVAMDLKSRQIKWRFRTASPMNTAALTTAGGLVFVGDWDRNVYAFNDNTGEVLWHTRLSTSAQGYPISYFVDGDQYIAIPTGTGGASWSTLVPNDLVPELNRPDHGNALFVFRLPGKKLPGSSEITRQVPKVLVEPTRPTAEQSVKDGVYTQQQAQLGNVSYAENCAACHGDALQGVGTAPGLTGANFLFVWGGSALQTLFDSIKGTMPTNAPGSLSDETYVSIIAYLLAHNGYPAGDEILTTDVLDNYLIESQLY